MAVTVCAIVLAGCESALRSVLFRSVSYSNSESIDKQLRDRASRADWKILFVGDSETRWGINPEEVDATFSEAGIDVRSFNHAFDGFGAPWWPWLLPKMLAHPDLNKVKVVVLGVQLIDAHRVLSGSGVECGSLQKPVLDSPFALDLGVDFLCSTQSWDARLGKKIFGHFWIVKYASAVRAFVLPQFVQGHSPLKANSRKAGEAIRGFEPHRTIDQDRANFDDEFKHWKAQYVPEKDFVSLPRSIWPELTSPSGFFDQLNEVVRNQGKELVLFALPTNPLLIDTFNRRADYRRNSALLQEWARARKVIFVDTGIQDNVNRPDIYFSDMRHLSGEGAKIYSKMLGRMLVQRGVLRSHKI